MGRPRAADRRHPHPRRRTPPADGERILVDGDLAVGHVKASRPGAPDTAVADFFRIEDGRLAEHGDVLQTVPAPSADAHPLF